MRGADMSGNPNGVVVGKWPLFQHGKDGGRKGYRMSAPHQRLLAIIARSPRVHIAYDALADRIGVKRKSVPVFICHLHRNGLIRRIAPFCFEAV
jgi:DNA-binding MarR family transcriptional regulator